MSGLLVSVRLDAEAIAEIDGRVGSRGRSGFIRAAVAAALKAVTGVPCAREAVREPASAVDEANVRRSGAEAPRLVRIDRKRVLDAAEQERADKMKMLLGALRLRSMTARQAAAELGWPELLVAKVADKLVAAGLVHFPRGAGVMEAKG